jgi:hypothetical protein
MRDRQTSEKMSLRDFEGTIGVVVLAAGGTAAVGRGDDAAEAGLSTVGVVDWGALAADSSAIGKEVGAAVLTRHGSTTGRSGRPIVTVDQSVARIDSISAETSLTAFQVLRTKIQPKTSVRIPRTANIGRLLRAIVTREGFTLANHCKKASTRRLRRLGASSPGTAMLERLPLVPKPAADEGPAANEVGALTIDQTTSSP